jgi:cysteinyl-tRNA synthetase
MPLVLYNSLTRRKEKFEPIDPGRVGMYVCGPTVYDFAHIGNARAVVAFDLLYRVLRHEYGADHVRYVRNITDIDDKIIDAARANGEPIEELTKRTAAIFQEDMAALGNLRPDVEPRATEHIDQMKAMIERLIATQHAYEREGHVLFSVASWPSYGRLSRRSRQEMIAGARVEIAPYKRDPGDFVLWKPSSADQPGWESPWGRGRPGWHIECSAMSEAHLGESFDIHGGGLDLIFPHHENELAQSESAHEGRKFVNFWVHNGFLSVDSTKMSKSLGNFVTAHDVLKEWPGEVVRLALLMTHYRDPLDWTEDRLREARAILDHWYRALLLGNGPDIQANPSHIDQTTIDSLQDDLNLPRAIRFVNTMMLAINAAHESDSRLKLQETLLASAQLLGLLSQKPEDWFRPPSVVVRPSLFVDQSTFPPATIAQGPPSRQYIDEQIAQRVTARRERRFAEADRIRAQLGEWGIVLEDKPDGTTEWRQA